MRELGNMMFCPYCEEEHKVLLKSRNKKTLIKDQEVKYQEKYFLCTKCNEEFITGKIMDENLLASKNQYRIIKGLLTSEEIKKTRMKYSLTQAELANILGFGEITITRYENKSIQEISHDTILREINRNPLLLYELLEKNKQKISQERYEKIKENIKKINEVETRNYLNSKELESIYINYNIKNIDNGNTILDVEKLTNIVGYIVKQMKNIKKTKLMKILWYCDSLFYKYNNRAITGLVYAHENFGALPLGNEYIIKLPSIKYTIEIIDDEKYRYNICFNEKYEIKDIDKREKEIIDKVIEKFKDYNAEQIVEYMHNEKAYKETLMSEVISFDYAKTLKEFN